MDPPSDKKDLPAPASGRPAAVQGSLFPELEPLATSSARPFRSELTVEQASLFVSNEFDGEFFEREERILLDDGECAVQRLVVGRLHETDKPRGVLRQRHQDVLYSILQLWAQQGYPVVEIDGRRHGHVKTSVYALVEAVCSGDDTARNYRRVRELVHELQSVPIVLENVRTWQGLRDREQFTLLGNVRWSERRIDARGVPSKEGRSEVRLLLGELVTQGFLARHSKVLLGASYDALGGENKQGRRSEIARLLYPYLDEQLEDRPVFEASLVDLAKRFLLKQYPFPSKRKEKFAPAIRVLQGTPIHGGRHLLRLELRAVDAPKDFVLCARREPVA